MNSRDNFIVLFLSLVTSNPTIIKHEEGSEKMCKSTDFRCIDCTEKRIVHNMDGYLMENQFRTTPQAAKKNEINT